MYDKNLRLLRKFFNDYNINIFTEHLDAAGEYTYDVFAESKCIYAKWNDDTKSMYYANTC